MQRQILLACFLLTSLGTGVSVFSQAVTDDIVFIHHSCGENWLNGGLRSVLSAKSYIDEVNDIYYGDVLQYDSGRTGSLGSVPGDNTNMNHWILWFNDYLQGIKKFGCATGTNAIIMYKSCFPLSDISSNGSLPGDPFSSDQTLTNYQSVYRKSGDPTGTYKRGQFNYKPLEQIFAENPETLFIAVTSPPLNYGPTDSTTNANAARARKFNNWLKNEWLASYNAANPGKNNVSVYDWFDQLAYPDDDPNHPNRLRKEYGGESGDSHPSSSANQITSKHFAAFLDPVYNQWKTVRVDDWMMY